VAAKKNTYSRSTLDASQVLGNQIAQARRARRMPLAEFAQRVGVSEPTARNIENGSPSVAIGSVFEAARIVGLPLFSEDSRALASMVQRGEEQLALLPSRVRARNVKDDF
jgi:transcriptional regulator with XRE-family HTH domain